MVDSSEVAVAWRDLGQRLARLRKAAGHTQQSFASLARYGRSSIANVETGYQRPERAFWMQCDDLLRTGGLLARDYDRIAARAQAHRQQQTDSRSLYPPPSPHLQEQDADAEDERVRGRVEARLGCSDVTLASLDMWERTVVAHARATRYRPPTELLSDLLRDVDDLCMLRERRHTSATLRHTTILTAQLAGMISLTLLKMSDAAAARRWGRTACTAAADAGDPQTCSWVWAQEAYRHFYAGDFTEAVHTARHARASASAGGVGAVLAAALEGRAYAAIGDHSQTRRSLDTAEKLLGDLSPDQTQPSAFGYDEAQLRFHAGNAYTYLGDTQAAWLAQQRALQLYPQTDYLDRALVGLDHAACLLSDGDVTDGVKQLTDVLTCLTPAQREGIILNRARQVLAPAAAVHHTNNAVRDATDLIALCAGSYPEFPS